MTPQTVVLIHGSRTINAAQQFLTHWAETGSRDPLAILEIDHRVDRRLAPPGTLWRTPDDYVTEEDAARIDADANAIADHWHEHFRADPSECDGLSLAAVVRSELALLLIPILKTIFLVDRLIQLHQAQRIVLGDGLSLHRLAARQIAARHGVTIDELPVDPAVRIEPQWQTPTQAPNGSLLSRAASACADQVPSMRAARMDIRRAREARAIGRPVVLSFDDFTVGDPRHADLCRSERFTYLTLYRRPPLARWFRRHVIKRRYARLFSARWRAVEMTLAPLPLMHYRGVALWPALREWFAKQFQDAFPYLAAEAAAMRRRIQELQPSMLLVQWVMQGRCALAIELARVMNVPVGVLQTYWCPGRAYPGNMRDHLHADHFFLWSAISKTWCEHPSRVPARCHFVTHPNYPAPANAPQSAVRNPQSAINRRPTILLTAQYWGPWTAIHAPKDTDDLWPAFIAAARACPEFDFIGKLHPNMNAIGHEGPAGAQRVINALPLSLPDNFLIAPFQSDVRDWLATDVVVTYYSTTSIEAALAGKWLVLLNLSGKRDFLPEAFEDGYAQAVHAAEDLPGVLRRVLHDPELQQQMEAGRLKYLQRAIAPGSDLCEVISGVLRRRCRCAACATTATFVTPRPAPRRVGDHCDSAGCDQSFGQIDFAGSTEILRPEGAALCQPRPAAWEL